MSVRKRLPDVPSLSKILPIGSESGKEFARIVDLLLFFTARSQSRKITIYSDMSGDVRGLDSYEKDKGGALTGYQYKFFPSPLSSEHRSRIIQSLQTVARVSEDNPLKKWVLVTPDDFIETSQRKGGGDVSWFEGLRAELGLEFEIEHWGHKQLIALFIENQSLCLYYYPDLVLNGVQKRISIQETRNRYDANLLSLYRNIEFVGMSIYKEPAAGGIPIEKIYIPLSVIAENSADQEVKAKVIDPLRFLVPGNKTVILGDPGSGKTTLLRFLALSGISSELGERYQTNPDSRLPVYVILRRYADELKGRRNLSLLEYFIETIQADYSLPDANESFFNFYLERGQAVLLFDGLDELPDSSFKELIRNRIQSLNLSFPGNTFIVTSRIVGYDNPFRFNDKVFGHYKLGRLKLPEITRFVKDWYNSRIENEHQSRISANDLIRILGDKNNQSIRELAENPLLLTIVALVHRIDAVLPDERVVLYQKCTETLLNTWHTWKFREQEIKNKGRVERRNRQRMESIAFWVHSQSLGTDRNQKSVIPARDLHRFLTQYITANEKSPFEEGDPEDIASDFLEFIKKRAGLLIEVGDQQYSFVHLTFQEYLCSSYIITISEKSGIENTWSGLQLSIIDPRWHEVMRLLIAGLRSDESQDFMLSTLLGNVSALENSSVLLLLGGLITDNVNIALFRRIEILRNIIVFGARLKAIEDVRLIYSFLQGWTSREASHEKFLQEAFLSAWEDGSVDEQKAALLLFLLGAGYRALINEELLSFSVSNKKDSAYFRLFFNPTVAADNYDSVFRQRMDTLFQLQCLYSVEYSVLRFFSTASHALQYSFEPASSYGKLADTLLYIIAYGQYRTFLEYVYNLFKIGAGHFDSVDKSSFINVTYIIATHDILNEMDPQDFYRLQQAIREIYPIKQIYDFPFQENNSIEPDISFTNMKENADSFMGEVIFSYNEFEEFRSWLELKDIPDLTDPLLRRVLFNFDLNPKMHWIEALRMEYLPTVPDMLPLRYDRNRLNEISNLSTDTKLNSFEEDFLACQIILDTWLYIFRINNRNPNPSLLNAISKANEGIGGRLKGALQFQRMVFEGII